jgi:excisionase family DNA binding protein
MRSVVVKPGRQSQRSFYGVGEFADAIGVGQELVRRAIHDGRLPALKFGGRYTIPARVLDELVEAVMSGGLVDINEWTPAADSGVAS